MNWSRKRIVTMTFVAVLVYWISDAFIEWHFFGQGPFLDIVIRNIPGHVFYHRSMGAIMLLLFGMIAAIGVNSLVRARVDMSRSRNLVIASVILTAGIGDMTVTCGRFCLGGIGFAGLVGVLLNWLLPGRREAHADGTGAAAEPPA